MTSVIILCAGESRRFSGGGENKTLYLLNGKPLFIYSLETFRNWGADRAVIVTRKEERAAFESFLEEFDGIDMVIGGKRRQDSVCNALETLPKDEIVLIHDGARPMISKDLIERVAEKVTDGRCVVPVISSEDALRIEIDGKFTTLDRSKVFRMQTPQGCFAGELLRLYRRFESRYFYDDAAAFEEVGLEVWPVHGDGKNL